MLKCQIWKNLLNHANHSNAWTWMYGDESEIRLAISWLNFHKAKIEFGGSLKINPVKGGVVG